MYKEILSKIEQPEAFQPSEKMFWQDEYIAKQLLKAHLNPNHEGASREPKFIDASVRFISQLMNSGDRVVDLGCGPGLYCEQLAMRGYAVTGIDFSENSIAYAKAQASERHLPIQYRFEDYLNMDDVNTFDFATLIYCDYGALSPKNRKQLLKNIYRCLTESGRLFLDVFTVNKYHSFVEGKQWSMNNQGGFWSAHPFLEISHNKKYDEEISLEQTLVLTEETADVYHIWHQYFTKERLIRELRDAGFKVINEYSNVAGEPYTDRSETMAILVQK
ncbi:methyltransferase domain-containing protein [Cytobacillus kochii]|uniref:class I SAM-dependent methyltransferase n=1 Tax=Cytobacillus kochii TaxID=859143 RepID=UPI00384E5E3B